MIATDLDGTLLRSDKTISEYTASVFKRCRSKGIKIVFATARPVRAVVRWLKINIESDACIYHNGAVVKIGEAFFQKTGIEYSTVRKLIKAENQFKGIKIAVEINDELYANFDASSIWPGVEYKTTDLRCLPELPADKIIFITDDSREINKLKQLLNENLYGEISENKILMVMNKMARKRNALKALVAEFGVSLAETAAFVDDYNEIEMLRDCGTGIAVANAIDEVKAAADYIYDTNDNDSVAK